MLGNARLRSFVATVEGRSATGRLVSVSFVQRVSKKITAYRMNSGILLGSDIGQGGAAEIFAPAGAAREPGCHSGRVRPECQPLRDPCRSRPA